MQLLYSTDLGLKALIFMAVNRDRLVGIAEMGDVFQVKQPAFRRPLKALADNGIIGTQVGRSGGYILRKDPGDIYLGEIIDMIEREFNFLPLMEVDENGGVKHPNSILRFALEQAKTSFFARLDHYTIADISEDPHTLVALGIPHSHALKRRKSN